MVSGRIGSVRNRYRSWASISTPLSYRSAGRFVVRFVVESGAVLFLPAAAVYGYATGLPGVVLLSALAATGLFAFFGGFARDRDDLGYALPLLAAAVAAFAIALAVATDAHPDVSLAAVALVAGAVGVIALALGLGLTAIVEWGEDG